MVERAQEGTAALLPYLPRLLTTWLVEDPGTSWREVEGTVVFVDISGFTKLSEKLAKSGKVGAEELADAIGSCFARLLAVAYGNGGGLIKFGGDALLLLFHGEEHAVRACRAAVGMRRALRDIGKIETSGGKVGLRMSVGVHSGTFHFFLVGTSHRELIVTGPSATMTATMEGTAEAGEILISPTTAAMLPARCLGAEKGPGILLKSEPPGLTPQTAEPSVTAPPEAIQASISVATREHLMYGTHEPEHRQVAIAFIHFDGTDAMIEREGSARFAKHMDRLVRDVQAAVDDQEVCFLGSDVDKDGGKIILTAGAPRGTGNDEERLLLAVRRIVGGERAIPIRIGVNRGRVFAGDIGPSYRRTFTVMGDAVNLAARVMAKAEPGQVLVTGEVLERSRTTFGTVELEPFYVKGKARPVQAYELGEVEGARHADEPEGAQLLPLIGREKEMAAMREALDAARGGHGRVVELIGEPGIGKSRLLEELRRTATGFVPWAAACQLYEASSPYFPFRALLREALGLEETDPGALAKELAIRVEDLDPGLLPWLPLLGVVLDIDLPDTPETAHLDERFRKARVEQVAAQLLDALWTRPTLVTIEDSHWMDEASSDLLRYLIGVMERRPWMVCTTRRDVATGFSAEDLPGVSVLRPAPLRPEDAAALVGAATEESPLAPHEIAALAERSGGNPLFLKELLAAAQAAGGLEGLPDSVEAVITAQIDRLRPRDRTLLRYASVLGQTFSREIAQSVLSEELPGLADDPWQYLAAFIVREGPDRLRFQHALIRDSAYDGLPFRRRRSIHARVGETIERSTPDPDEHAEILSMHFFSSDDMERAWRYSRVAGERSQQIYANVEAAEFYQRAAEAARRIAVPPTELAAVYGSLGDVRDRAGKYDDAAAAYKAARKLVADDRLAQAGLLLKEAEIRERLGKYPQALRWYTRGMHAIDGLEDPAALQLRARLRVGYATIRQGQTHNREAIRWCEGAIRDAEASGAREVIAHAAHTLDWIYTAMGRPQDAPYPGLALQIYEELQDLPGLGREYSNLGIFAYYEGRWDDAVDLYQRGQEAREKLGDTVHAAMGTYNIAEIRSDQGLLGEAEAGMLEALRIWQASGYREGVAYATMGLGRVASRAGRHDEAEERFAQARALFTDIGEERPALETDVWAAECRLYRGDPAGALALVSSCLRRSKGEGFATVQAALHRLRGYALMQSAELEEASAAIEESLAIGREHSAEFEVGQTLEAAARFALLRGDTEESARLREEYRDIFGRLGIKTTPSVPIGTEARS